MEVWIVEGLSGIIMQFRSDILSIHIQVVGMIVLNESTQYMFDDGLG
jgi:hypothetical protein